MGTYSRELCSPLSNVLSELSSPQFFYLSQARLFSPFILSGDFYWNGPSHRWCTSCTSNTAFTGNIFSGLRSNTSNSLWKDYKWLFPQSPVSASQEEWESPRSTESRLLWHIQKSAGYCCQPHADWLSSSSNKVIRHICWFYPFKESKDY